MSVSGVGGRPKRPRPSRDLDPFFASRFFAPHFSGSVFSGPVFRRVRTATTTWRLRGNGPAARHHTGRRTCLNAASVPVQSGLLEPWSTAEHREAAFQERLPGARRVRGGVRARPSSSGRGPRWRHPRLAALRARMSAFLITLLSPGHSQPFSTHSRVLAFEAGARFVPAVWPLSPCSPCPRPLPRNSRASGDGPRLARHWRDAPGIRLCRALLSGLCSNARTASAVSRTSRASRSRGRFRLAVFSLRSYETK